MKGGRERAIKKGYAVAAMLLACGWASAEPSGPAQPRGQEAASFARFVPPSTGVFITVRRLGEVSDALRQAHAWRLVPLLTGTGTDDDLPFDLRTAVNAFLGPKTSISIDDLMKTEVGLAARSWSDVADGVWYARVDDEQTLDRWFPKDRRKSARLAPSARLFRMDDGVVACLRDGVVAMARRTGGGTLMAETRLLMSGRRVQTSLADTAGFRELIAYLPSKPLAVAYLAKVNVAASVGSGPPERENDPPAATDDSGPTTADLGRWWEAFDRAVIGMYARDERIDLALRGVLNTPHPRTPLAPGALQVLRELPQTTLAAWALTADLDRAFERSSTTRPLGRLGRYMRLLAGLPARDGRRANPLPSLGPHVILAWDQDMTEAATPQLAVLLECKQARVLNGEVTRIVESILDLLDARDPVDRESTPAVRLTTYLGVPISYVPLDPYAAKSRFPVAKLLEHLEPSWAAHGDWVIITLSRDHLERILDSRFGLVPTLGAADETRAVWERPEDRTQLIILQAGLASKVLERWLSRARAGAPSLLNPSSWGGPELMDAFQSTHLGIAIGSEGEPGAVVVTRVYPNTAAAGRLRPGDRIMGLDGQMLDLGEPGADLRRRWADKPATPARTLRVRRGDATIDVTLSPRDDPPVLSDLLVDPIDAVRELASVGRSLRFASLSVHETDEKHFSALLSLRFDAGERRPRPQP